MKKTIFLQVIVLALSLSIAQAQLIVQFHSKKGEETSMLKNHKLIKDIDTKLSINKQLSQTLNIWLLNLDNNTTNPKTLLQELKKNPAVKNVAFNEAVQHRALPNDDFFTSQWQYENRGISGTLDADIDAPDAWEITTGGTTATGQEIVVAILDGGVLLQHPDLADNFWRNPNEIPDNGIDDDNNGYTDDAHGWNFNSNNNDISNGEEGHWHGSPVAGIIGARGNNGTGVSGVNWDVKIMNLVANDSVHHIIQAYDYILQMRRRYNETNGAEGAFIVSTNASLGINNGRPEEHPIWCEMYDLLGQAGVLSVAATANAGIDVDIAGDLPTTCTSDFLISVTNTNNKDNKEESAAYGQTHIDLGAPGTGVFTIKNSGGYGTFGGTSAASPHVAGAVALLYAAPVLAFMEDAQENPAQHALLVKDFILNGADLLPDLQSRSVTGGRLNLNKSLLELYRHYDISLERNNNPIALNAVYPNPTRDEVHVQFTLNQITNVIIQVRNLFGQQVQQAIIGDADKGSHQITLALGKLQEGIYFINVHSKDLGKLVSAKVVVQ